MNIEVMEKKLYDACLKGDVETLEALMREDKLTLARVSISSCFNQTPLHLACMLGHFEFAKSLLSYKPDFASMLDSQARSPLHLASANGYANIVQLLLGYDDHRRMCRVRDEDGRTPLHLAVINGQHESVSELIKVNSELFDVQELGTVLHLCVMYNRLNVLMLVLESIDHLDLSNIKDDNGDSILHSATALRRMQIIKYLVRHRSEVDVNVVNENGETALDIIEQMPKLDVKSIEIKELLISAGTLRGEDINKVAAAAAVADDNIQTGRNSNSNSSSSRKKMRKLSISEKKEKKRDETLLVAASVIAAIAYQAATSPPGGVAGMDAFQHNNVGPGDSLLARFYPDLSNRFWICNTIAFMASLSVIFVYVSGASLKRRLFIWPIRAGMWITLSAMTFAYVYAVLAITPSRYDIDQNPSDLFKHYNSALGALVVGLLAWVGLIFLSILVLVYRFFSYILRTLINIIKATCCGNNNNKKKKNTRDEAAPTFTTTNIV